MDRGSRCSREAWACFGVGCCGCCIRRTMKQSHGWTVEIIGRQNEKRQATLRALISSIDYQPYIDLCKLISPKEYQLSSLGLLFLWSQHMSLIAL
jgi:hypothetical protein